MACRRAKSCTPNRGRPARVCARRQRGWTLWEGVVGLNVIGLAVVLFASLFSTMQGTRHEAFARHGAQETLRRNLEALAGVLRTADIATLDGFDATGSSRRLRFVRTTDGNGIGGSPEVLFWQPVTARVPGVDAPGRVLIRRAGVERVVAEHVPAGAFSVRWDAGMLVVELSTYHVFKDEAQTVHGSTAVLVGN